MNLALIPSKSPGAFFCVWSFSVRYIASASKSISLVTPCRVKLPLALNASLLSSTCLRPEIDINSKTMSGYFDTSSQFALWRWWLRSSIPVFSDFTFTTNLLLMDFSKLEILKLTVPEIELAVPLTSSRGVELEKIIWFSGILSLKTNFCVSSVLT